MGGNGRADRPDFWERSAALHRDVALFHQYEQLERHGAIDAFRRLVARTGEPVTAGLPVFVSDSDVHKWVDAAARWCAHGAPAEVRQALDEVVGLMAAAHDAGLRVNTWIGTEFPDAPFANLTTEHEFYICGHLVEAAISLAVHAGDDRLLPVARAEVARVEAFLAGAGDRQDGHAELELALVRLHRELGEPGALQLASRLLDRRGTAADVRRQVRGNLLRTGVRLVRHERTVRRYAREHPGWAPAPQSHAPPLHLPVASVVHTISSFLTGSHFQCDRPVRQFSEPTGHAVAFHYLQAGMAAYAAATDDDDLRAVGESAWGHEVGGHLFVTGGAGAHPGMEGYGDPFDLDPERAYCETCAGVSGVLWNREMARLTDDPRYDDLAEWQLLNAAAVGVASDGLTWSYDNALQTTTGVHRATWFHIPCCPSNLSRLWATLPWESSSLDGATLTIHQFTSGTAALGDLDVTIESGLPWSGDVRISWHGDGPATLRFRVPSWTDHVEVVVGGASADAVLDPPRRATHTASGLDPERARWGHVAVDATTEVLLRFGLPVRLRRQDPRVPRVGGRVAVTRGPLVYCLEAVDHPDRSVDALLDAAVDPASLVPVPADHLLPGAVGLRGSAPAGRPLTFVPYFLWGNRGPGAMTCFVRVADGGDAQRESSFE